MPAPTPRVVDRTGRAFADWWSRAVARLLDAAIVLIGGMSLVVILTANGIAPVRRVVSIDRATGVVTTTDVLTHAGWIFAGLVLLVLWLGYFSLFDGSRHGQTPGKRVAGIQVRDRATGEAMGAARALAREALVLGFWCVLVLGGVVDALSPLWDRCNQSLHDRIVGSVVVEVSPLPPGHPRISARDPGSPGSPGT